LPKRKVIPMAREPKIYAIGDEALQAIADRSAGSSGGDGSGIESRVAKIEAAIEHIQTDIADMKTEIRSLRQDAKGDFRVLFGAIIAVALGIAGLMAKGFHWL
jgi:hypothetical protein